MSTHAFIGYQEDDLITYVYLHFDGYYEHTGKLLSEYHHSTEKAKALVAMGGISSLDKTITTSKFYCRDRVGFQPDDRAETPVISHGLMADLILEAKGCFAKYLYIWQPSADYWLHIDISKL